MNDPRFQSNEVGNRDERLRRIQQQLGIEPNALSADGPVVAPEGAEDGLMTVYGHEAGELASVLARPEIWRELQLVSQNYFEARSHKDHGRHSFCPIGREYVLRDDGTLWEVREAKDTIYPLTITGQVDLATLDGEKAEQLLDALHHRLYSAEHKIALRGGTLRPLRQRNI